MGLSVFPQVSGVSATDLITQPEWTLLGTNTSSGTRLTVSSIPTTYRTLRIHIALYNNTNTGQYRLRLNNNTSIQYYTYGWGNTSTTVNNLRYSDSDGFAITANVSSGNGFSTIFDIENYASATETTKFIKGSSASSPTGSGMSYWFSGLVVQSSAAAVTSIDVVHAAASTILPDGLGIRVYGGK